MASVSHHRVGVARTERGLVIAGTRITTRITLYQLMDYLHAGHPYSKMQQDFPQVTDQQFAAALS